MIPVLLDSCFRRNDRLQVTSNTIFVIPAIEPESLVLLAVIPLLLDSCFRRNDIIYRRNDVFSIRNDAMSQ